MEVSFLYCLSIGIFKQMQGENISSVLYERLVEREKSDEWYVRFGGPLFIHSPISHRLFFLLGILKSNCIQQCFTMFPYSQLLYCRLA